MYNKIIFIILFLLLINNNIYSLTCGQNQDEILGDYKNNNHLNINYDDSQLYFNGNSKYLVYRQLSAGILKAHGLTPATYEDYGINGAYKFAKNQNQSISCAIAIPSNLDRTVTASVRIGFSSQAVTGDVKFKIDYNYISLDEDVSTTNIENTITTTANVSAIKGGYNYAFFNLVNPSLNDKILVIRITRMSNEDTIDNDIYIIGISKLYYANKLGG